MSFTEKLGAAPVPLPTPETATLEDCNDALNRLCNRYSAQLQPLFTRTDTGLRASITYTPPPKRNFLIDEEDALDNECKPAYSAYTPPAYSSEDIKTVSALIDLRNRRHTPSARNFLPSENLVQIEMTVSSVTELAELINAYAAEKAKASPWRG